MIGHHQKQKTMMTKMRKVMIVITRLVQDRNQVIVKLIAVPTRRPLLNPRQSTRETTRRENKKKRKKRKQLKRKSEKLKKNLLDFLCLPQRMLFEQQLKKLQPIPLQLVDLILHQPMHRQQMQPPNGGHPIGYKFTMRGRVPKGGHQELEPWQKYDTSSVLVAY
jgi:hypothetical protein